MMIITPMIKSTISVEIMISAIANVYKYSLKNTVVTESMISTSQVTFPSITMCPQYKPEYALSKTSGTKNLTEYYENLLNIKKDVISISQPYTTTEG